MVLALEEGYDRPSWWHNGRWRAESISEQEVQPLFTMKDAWELCTCEGGPSVLPQYGQYDEETGGALEEYVWCPLGGGNPDQASPGSRYDWRPGRELTEEQATRWALAHDAPYAHHIFNGPSKEATTRVHLPAANGIWVDGVDISAWVSGQPELQLTDWQRSFFDNGPRAVTVSIDTDSPESFFTDTGIVRINDGRNWLSVPMARDQLEDGPGREDLIRTLVDEFNRRFGGGGREGGGADRSGSASEGAAQ